MNQVKNSEKNVLRGAPNESLSSLKPAKRLIGRETVYKCGWNLS